MLPMLPKLPFPQALRSPPFALRPPPFALCPPLSALCLSLPPNPKHIKNSRNIILFSAPRSGSTWLSQVLTYDSPLRRIHEPDNELNTVLGLYYKRGLARFPLLTEKDAIERYAELFQTSFRYKLKAQDAWQNVAIQKVLGLKRQQLQANLAQKGVAREKPLPASSLLLKAVKGPRSKQPHLVKTVHSLLALPYLTDRLAFRPLILQRHPLNVFSSYHNMKMPDADRKLYRNKRLLKLYDLPTLPDPAHTYSAAFRAGYQLGLFNRVIEDYKQRFPQALFLDYEQLIAEPFEQIPALMAQIDQEYSPALEQFMQERFTAGSGYTTKRDPAQQAKIWKKRLSAFEEKDFLRGYELSFGRINFSS